MKNRKKLPDKNSFSKLRVEAEKALTAASNQSPDFEEKDVNTLFQELQVHQIELEMQNDELRITNEELLMQQMKFEGIYNLAPIGYFILDSSGIVEEVNNAGISLLDSQRFNVVNKRLNTFVAPEHNESFYRFFAKLLKATERQSCQIKFIAKSGRMFYAQVQGIFIDTNSTGSKKCYLAVVDITERIQAERNLAQTKERLELALEASSTGTWELDLQTMQFYFDEFIYRICNLSLARFNGSYQSFMDYIHEDDRLMADQHFRTAVNNDKEVDMVCRFTGANGKTCYVSIRGHVAEADGTRRFVGIMTDITEKKRLEEEAVALKFDQQKQITTATLHAEENERRRISEALHDSVSQLLYGIKIQLNQLTSQSASDKSFQQVTELLNIAIQETRNISFELAPSLLADFGLPATIDELVRRLSSPQLRLQAKVTGFNTRCNLLQETSIFRIVQELINNAIKHSGANLITIEIKKNKLIEITVHDNGKGFDVKKQEKTPGGSGFSSIKNRLGLYNGILQIESAECTGTTIKIKLHPATA